MIWLHHTISWILLFTGHKKILKWPKDNLYPFLLSVYILWSIIPDFDFIFRLLNMDIIGHKTLTHSILFFLLLILFINRFINKKYLIYLKAFSIGYMIHLLLDIVVWWKIYLYWFWENVNMWIQFLQLSHWYNWSIWYFFSLCFLYLIIHKTVFHKNLKNELITYFLIILSIFWDLMFVFKLI